MLTKVYETEDGTRRLGIEVWTDRRVYLGYPKGGIPAPCTATAEINPGKWRGLAVGKGDTICEALIDLQVQLDKAHAEIGDA